MKFLASIPGHTRTNPMSQFVPTALEHEMVTFSYAHQPGEAVVARSAGFALPPLRTSNSLNH